MSAKDHPLGLCPEEREEFNFLMKRIFELYEKMPLDADPSKFRKLLGGWCEGNPTLNAIFFLGSNEESAKVIHFIKTKL